VHYIAQGTKMGFFAKLKDEINFLALARKTNVWIEELTPNHNVLIADDWERICDQNGTRPAIIYENKTLSYSQLDHLANRYANWAFDIGLRAGDVVAIFMQNHPDYIACWYGLAKIGIVSALINQNLIGSQLLHSVSVAKAKAVIVDDELAPIWASIAHELPDVAGFARFGTPIDGLNDLDRALNAQSNRRPNRIHRSALIGKDPCLYLYTSGTTGSPKAAVISQSRVQGMSRVFIAGSGANRDDKVYISLPLYHGTGGICAVGLALNTGGCIVLRKRFSATQFWPDIVNYKCTIFVYIGEMFRYLVTQDPIDLETKHSLKSCFGNGLRPEVWERAQARYKIPKIMEFYGSTEGNVFLTNLTGRKGAIGRKPKYLEKKINISLVKFDIENEVPIRDENGLCIFCGPEEVGEAIGRLDPNDPRGQFDGYANDAEATNKKILRNVKTQGDKYFRTGDLMRQDKDGYFYFVDRIGDTYRWKSENVSTADVGSALGTFDGIIEANAYGVNVPHHEGRAGMAVIVADKPIEYDALLLHLKAQLPNYALPLFLRLKKEVETTATFKYKKIDLVSDGFDPNKNSDEILWLNPKLQKYEKLTDQEFININQGNIRF
jgi:fatty-acyl-CoA synthase